MTAPESAQELVRLLRSRGLTDQVIGRAVGRDSSLIFQIGRGAKPGRNLLVPLGDLLAGRPVTEPVRRRQRVRTKTVEGDEWRTKRFGKQAIANTAGDSLERELEKAAAQGRLVGITVTTKKPKSRAQTHYMPQWVNRPAADVLAEFKAWHELNRGTTVVDWLRKDIPADAGPIIRIEFRSWNG